MLRDRERMKENGIAPLTWEGKRSAAAVADAEVVDKPIRRRFAPSYKLRIVEEGSSPELCVKVRGSSSMLLLGCLGDLLRFEKREIQVATFAPDRSSP